MSYTYLVVGALVACGLVGYQRGWLREVATLGGLLLAWVATLFLGDWAIALVNRLQLIVAFVVRNGFDATSPALVIQEIRRHPLVDPGHPDLFLGSFFGALVLLAYVLASRFVRAESTTSARALGVLVGLVNGYVLSYLALRFLAPAARVGLTLPESPSDSVHWLGTYLPTLLVGGVVLAIAIALLSTKRAGTGGRAAPNRAKG